jgi:SRSO17 transposase
MVEPFHEEAKGELGWDQYQGRLWLGFNRHAVVVLRAYRFLV